MGNHPRVLSKEVMLSDIFFKDYKSYSWETGLQAAVNWKLLGSHRNHPSAKHINKGADNRVRGIGPGLKHVKEVSWTRSPLRDENSERRGSIR